MIDSSALRIAAEKGLHLAVERDFRSPDPYDGLLSPAAKLLPSKVARQLWVQGLKRSGIGARRLLGVPEVRMAKSLALFSMAAAELGELSLAHRLIDDLLEGDAGPWGYEFDVQTRWAFYKAGSPNVVATTFVLRAIDRLGRIGEVPRGVGDWLRSLFDQGGFFRYTAASNALIHNGSLLAAESLARLGCCGDLVQSAVDTTVAHQLPTGGWRYGEAAGLDWEDSFHTVYVMDSLTEIERRGFAVGDSLDKVLPYWESAFFTSEGHPKYFANETRPTKDIHNNATVLGAISDYGHLGDVKRLAVPVAGALLSTQRADGAFRPSPIAPTFMRWHQGHAVLALSKIGKREFFENGK